MDVSELQELTQKRILLEGPSGYGKTYTSCQVALGVLEAGGSVMYVDTETEGSGTILNVMRDQGHDDEVIEDLEYQRVDDYDGMKNAIERASGFDLMVFDTLDHKHSYVLKAVADAKRDNDADWNEYPQIYGEEKEVMRAMGSIGTNVVATIDPESGSDSKPKGAQTNIRGYFTAVVEMRKPAEDEWGHKVIAWMDHPEWIGKKHPKFPQPAIDEVIEYSEV